MALPGWKYLNLLSIRGSTKREHETASTAMTPQHPSFGKGSGNSSFGKGKSSSGAGNAQHAK